MSETHQPGANQGAYAVETRALTRLYVSGHLTTTVVDHVDLKVRRGEFVAIMGASGSGKTSLLYLIAGLADPTSGEVLVKGTPLSTLTDSERARLRNGKMGFVFQRVNLLGFLSVRTNVEAPRLLNHGSHSRRGQRAEDLLAAVGLGGKNLQRVSQLSAGEQQRVAIARALMNGPEILLADEPTGNLDSHNAHAILNLLLRLRKELNLTILMVTHNPEVALMADRILEIHDGKIRREVNTQEISTREEWLRKFSTPFFEQLEK